MQQNPQNQQNLQIQVLTLEEVADLLEASEVLVESDFGPFKAIKFHTEQHGEAICITSHGDKHVVIHA